MKFSRVNYKKVAQYLAHEAKIGSVIEIIFDNVCQNFCKDMDLFPRSDYSFTYLVVLYTPDSEYNYNLGAYNAGKLHNVTLLTCKNFVKIMRKLLKLGMSYGICHPE